MMHLPPPPVPAQFRTDDVDEVRAHIARGDGEHSRQVQGAGPLGYEHVRLDGKSLGFHWVSQRLGQFARGGVTTESIIHLPMTAAMQYAFWRRRFEVGVGEAAFIVPGQRYTVQTRPGAVFAISVPLADVEREIRPYLRRADAIWLPRTRKLTLNDPAARRMAGHIADVVRILTSPGTSAGPALEQAEADLVAALSETLVASGGAEHASRLTAERTRYVEEWIEAHLHEAITLGRLCEVAGVGGRCLQKAFLDRRGSSPMQFVTERRLAAARALLSSCEPGREVTSIATACGFTHMGRFSTIYRLRFGESPSTTVRRRFAS